MNSQVFSLYRFMMKQFMKLYLQKRNSRGKSWEQKQNEGKKIQVSSPCSRLVLVLAQEWCDVTMPTSLPSSTRSSLSLRNSKNDHPKETPFTIYIDEDCEVLTDPIRRIHRTNLFLSSHSFASIHHDCITNELFFL